MKLVAIAVGVVVSVAVLMSLMGLVTQSVWIQLLVSVVVVMGVPLLVADRLLPKDGSARPGLVSDVLALLWMGGATATVALGSSVLQYPLEAQAERFEEHGWPRVAWATRWTAGVGESDHGSDEAPVAPGEAATLEGEPPALAAAEPDAAPAAGAEFTPAPSEDGRKTVAPAQLFKEWAPSVVTISVESPRGSGMGTGFVIDGKGTIATNHHVVADASEIEVKLFDGTKADEVELLETDPDQDLAVLRIKTKDMPTPVVLGESDGVVVGESVIVIGNPIGLEHTMTDGMVSSRRVYEGKKYIQMSAPVSPGNSGGPVFNQYGDVIGVTVAKLWGENLNLAIPIDVLKPMIKSEYPEARGFGSSRW
ncbi:MAG: trypsin-like peptidase domain-containing protein [Myxococcales bacterium]|nr:trypsin-like peptidase domain-containing protein [Myxococcales bacterium]